MIVIISDLHLTDGTSGQTIKENAFRIFARRVRDMAFVASWRKGGRYQPIERIDILLLGDILDVTRSTAWLEKDDGPRPWSDPEDLDYIGKLNDITTAILAHNASSLASLRNLAEPGGLVLPPRGGANGDPRLSEPGVPVEVGIHYMVGNHDWFYCLPGMVGELLRSKVAASLGLENEPEQPFPHEPEESSRIAGIQQDHGVRACHGDIFDPFNFSGSRDAASLGDAIVIELLNRFPFEVRSRMGSLLPRTFVEGLRELDNVRPLAAVPTWIDALLNEQGVSRMQARRVKDTWNDLVDDFLNLDFIRRRDSSYNPFERVDKLEYALRFTRGVPLGLAGLAGALGAWWNQVATSTGESYFAHEAREKAVKDRKARFLVYGHTHHHEIVPLDVTKENGRQVEQVYINAGTWRRVHSLARSGRAFVGYDVMTYLAFFKDDERNGRPFACWSGALGEATD